MADEDFTDAVDASMEVELTVTGRTSGREITTPVWFEREDDKLYLVPIKGTDSNWFKNVVQIPTIRLAVGGAQHNARATPISDPVRINHVLDAFRAKYGADNVAAYYSKQDAVVEVPLG